MPILDKTIGNEQYITGQQRGMFNDVLQFYDRDRTERLAYNERIAQANKPSFLGRLLPGIATIASLII